LAYTELDRFPNRYPVGRNIMQRYNDQDHSMWVRNNAVSAAPTSVLTIFVSLWR